MRSYTHSYLDDPPVTRLHRDAERLAIESALSDARLQRQEAFRHAVLQLLRHPRRSKRRATQTG